MKDGRRHFRVAFDAIRKDDRDFNDFKSGSCNLPAEFNLKTIAVAMNGIEIDALQGLSPKTFESASQISVGQSKDQACVEVTPFGYDKSMGSPSFYAPPGHVSTTEYKVRLFGGAKEIGQILRLVGKVGVHFKNIFVVFRKRPTKTMEVGVAKTAWARSVDHVDSVVCSGEPVCHVSGSIWAEIVDHKNVGLRELVQCGRDDLGQVVSLIVGWNDDERSMTGRCHLNTILESACVR